MKTAKFILLFACATILFSGCTKEAWQEMYLSDILGTWSGYSTIGSYHLTVTFYKDKTFTMRVDSEPEVSGTFKYVSVGEVIKLSYDGNEETWWVYDREEYSMTVLRKLYRYKLTRSGSYY